ncbi:MAG: VOC family protein [Armatimonadetes bacterium]|nr:VOC family protein [Armatimonadota bacterium]
MACVLDAIGIVTGNMARSLEFYRLLGVDTPLDIDDHVEATLPNGLRLMWDTEEVVKSFVPDWKKPIGQGIGLAFLCETPAEVDEIYAKMTDAGFGGAKEPWDAFWGQRYAQLSDPDGYTVDLFARLE